MPNEDITGEAVTDGAQLTPAVAEPAVGTEAMTLAELNQYLGKTFPTKETALKALKDTFSYVGKKTEDIKKEVLAEIQTTDKTEKLAGELEGLRKDMFYKDNPQYADPNIRNIIERIGGNPSDVVNSAEFKAVFEKVQGFEETQSKKTVLESNPRLAASKDALTKAADLKAKGASSDEIEAAVAAAVLA